MAYTEIIITAPDSANPGDSVQFSIGVKNISSAPISLTMECWAPDQSPANKLFDTYYNNLLAGRTVAWPPAIFVMPNYNAEIFVWVERWTGDYYFPDNAKLKTILLVGEPEFSNFGITEYVKR